MHSSLNLIRQGTDSSYVARNWHHHKVPLDVQKSIDETIDLIETLKNHNVDASRFEEDVRDMQRVLKCFLDQWPAPIITSIVDTVNPLESIPTEWYSKYELLQSRPLISLTCLSDNKDCSFIFYKNEATGEIFKVSHMWYNRPNAAKIVEFSY